MKVEKVEYNEFIATRVPPGDSWVLVNDRNKVIHKSLTDALEAWFEANQEKVEFRLAPLDSKLYAIRSEEKEIQPEPTKRYNLYGDPDVMGPPFLHIYNYEINRYFTRSRRRRRWNEPIKGSLRPCN
jgi:hypothetical protein